MRRRIHQRLAAVAVAVALGATTTAAQAAPSQWPDLVQPGARQGGGEADAAVIVAIEDYVFAPDVPGANENAEGWYRHLTSVRGVPVGNVRLLRDNEATLEEMRAAVKAAADQAGADGTLWFLFIGHGSPAKSGEDGLLVGVDAQQTSNSLEARSLRRSELVAALEASPAQPIVILDACFSGRSSSGEALAEGLQPLRIADLDAPKSAVVMTAARADQYAGALPEKDVPAFSYLMLGALRGWGDDDGNGTVTAEEALLYTANALRTVVKGRSQTPELTGASGGRALGAGGEPPPDLAAIVVAGSSQPVRDEGPGEAEGPEPGGECTDNRGCPAGLSCQAGACKKDFAYLDSLQKRASRLTTGGGVTLGIGGVLLITGATLVGLASARTIDNDTGSIAGWVVLGIGLVGTVAGGVLVGSGVKQKKRHRALVRLAPGGVRVHF